MLNGLLSSRHEHVEIPLDQFACGIVDVFAEIIIADSSRIRVYNGAVVVRQKIAFHETKRKAIFFKHLEQRCLIVPIHLDCC